MGFFKRACAAAMAMALAFSMVPGGAFAASEHDAAAAEVGVSGDAGSAGAEALRDESDATRKVTIIVQLEGGGRQGQGAGEPRSAQEADHVQYKQEIAGLAQDYVDDQVAQGAIAEADAQAASADVEEIADYVNEIDGFAVKAPAGILDDIRALDGVKRAYVERVFEVGESGGLVAAGGFSAGAANVTAGDSSIANQSTLGMAGVDAVGQKGDGQVIAILDSGFDTSHDAFSGAMDESRVSWTREVAQQKRSACVQGGRDALYISSKIPFAYDYGDGDSNVVPSNSGLDHGAHVAGIAAANGGETRGTAPGAQLALMKIANDFTGSIYESVLIAALDDAAAIHPDVVSLSLGSDGGFSSEDSDALNDIFAELESSGTTVCVSAGNSYTSAKGNRTGENLALASDPDEGVLSSPASSSHVTAVASLENARELPCFLAADGRQVCYVEGARSEGASYKLFEDLPDGTYEYIDAGYGTKEECDALIDRYGSFSGKILIAEDKQVSTGSGLVMSGNRASNLDALRPAAIILYNDGAGALESKGVSGVNRPVACIDNADGRALVNAEDKAITVKGGLVVAPTDSYSVNAFSSWGTTPEMTFKPEVAAPGGNVYSSVLNNEYGTKSGTSMATPYYAGLCALVREYVASDAKFASMGADDRRDVVNQLLMSTARPLENPSVEGGYYSPRQQGAGSADVSRAVATPVYLTVDGAAKSSRPKAELGESDQGAWSFTVRLHNVGDAEQSYRPDAVALVEAVSDGKFQQTSQDRAGDGVSVAFGGAAFDAQSGLVSVAAGSTASFTVAVSCDAPLVESLMAAAPNGTFVEGFAMLAAQSDGGVDLSVPYLGFLGDWSDAPVFDAVAGSGDDVRRYASRIVNAATGEQLGANPLGGSAEADASKAVVSTVDSDAAPNTLEPRISLLRGARTLRCSYADASGRVVRSYSYDYVTKSTKGSECASLVPAPVFTGTDDAGNPVADGEYTLTVTAETAGPTSEEQSCSFSFVLDTKAPEVESVAVSGSGADAVAEVIVSEENHLAGIEFVDPVSGEPFKRVLADEATVDEGAQGARTFRFEMPLADLEQAWAEAGNAAADFPGELTVKAWDYGLNCQTGGEEPSDDGFVIDEATGELTGYEGAATVVSVPDGVTGIAANALKGSTVKAVRIPASVESIGASAFAGTAKLTQVAFEDTDENPSRLTTISAGAFAGSAVRELTLPRSVTSLGASAFANTGLDVVRLPDLLEALPDSAFSGSSVRVVYLPACLRSIGASAFKSCANLAWVGVKNVEGAEVEGLPSSTQSIGEDAFRSSGAKKLVLNEGLVSIAGDAFDGSSLRELVVPNSVIGLKKDSLAGMKRLTKLTLGSKVTRAQVEAALSGCPALQDIEVDGASEHLRSQDGVLFTADGTALVSFPAGRAGAYRVPAFAREIAARAFSDAAVTAVSFAGASVSIGERVFAGSALAALDLSAVTAIGDSAFANCAALSSVDFSSARALTSIGKAAFSPGTPLGRVELPDCVSEVGQRAFANNASLVHVRIGASFTGDYGSVFSGCDNVASLDVSKLNQVYEVDRCVLYRKTTGGWCLQRALPAGRLSSYAVKSGTVTIGSYAFSGNASLVSLVLPEGVTTIETAAFSGCPLLRDVAFPDSLQTVTGFYGTSIEVADFGTGIKEIKSSAFNGHNPSRLIVRGGVGGTYASSLESGDDLQPIKSAFFGAGMKSANFAASSIVPPSVVVVPSSMSSLRFNAPSASLDYDPAGVIVYAEKGTAGWTAAEAALGSIGADVSAQLREYAPLSVAAKGSYDASRATATVRATATGGVTGSAATKAAGYAYRFIAKGADGTERVVSNWSASGAFSGSLAAGASLRCEVRDETGLTAGASVVLDCTSSQGAAVKKGKVYAVGSQKYKVTKTASAKAAGAVTFVAAKNARSVVVPAAVKLADGRTYRVKAVAARAFAAGKIRTVTIGKNVSSLARGALKGSKATAVVLKTKGLSKKGCAGCLAGSKVKSVKVSVGSKKANGSYAAKYRKIFTKKVAGRAVTVK